MSDQPGQGDRFGQDDQPGPPPSRRTKGIYFAMMGTCLGLCVIAWVVVARYSTVAAVVMSVAALVIPPVAAIIANAASATDRRRR
jgi:multisubunit Na+/H+ antiporter MnhG subunit